MITKHKLALRRVSLPVLALSTMLAAGGGFAIDAPDASAQTVNAQQEVSENWAGYVAQGSSGQSFSSVSGSWTQPAATSSSGTGGYSAFWVGIGGSSQQSQALEQVGTSSDVVNGQTQYYAWYELVPSPEVKLNLAIHPGDHMYGRVTVNGTTVTVSLSDQTTGQSVTKTLHMSNPDTSSAEWIAEAPAAASQSGNYQVLPLADFGKVTFTNAYATADGHTGSISDPNWSVQEVQLGSGGSNGFLGAGGAVVPTGLDSADQGSSGGATPGDLSGDGSSFSVSYTSDPGTAQSSTGGYGGGGGYAYPGGVDGSGYSGGRDGSGYPGGYGYSGGYGDPGYGYGSYGPDGYAY